MTIKKIQVNAADEAAVLSALDTLPSEKIDNCNWPEEYPYVPVVSFKVFHTGDSLIIRYDVREGCTAAAAAKDGDSVWLDSCCECFFAPVDNGYYYNLEASCNGFILLGHRKDRNSADMASSEVYGSIRRIPSLPHKPFAEFKGENSWSLVLIIPASAFFADGIKSFDGLNARMNFYKCGDNLSVPHFLSWAPIDTETPNFHVPEFFRNVNFE